MLESRRQRRDEITTAAPDIQRTTASVRQVSQEPAMKVIVVAPGMPTVERSQPTHKASLGLVRRLISHPCNVVKGRGGTGPGAGSVVPISVGANERQCQYCFGSS